MRSCFIANIKPPCKRDCPNRSANCHTKGRCKEWEEYQAKLAEVRETIAEERRMYKMSHYNYRKLNPTPTREDKE